MQATAVQSHALEGEVDPIAVYSFKSLNCTHLIFKCIRLYLRQTDALHFPLSNMFGTLTCPGVDGEKTLGIAAGDPVRQPVAGPGVWVNGVDLDD